MSAPNSVYFAAQQARALSLPRQLATQAPAREAALEPFRQRNTFLDSFFYDIGVITEVEAAELGQHVAAEGAIVLTPPSGAGALTLCCSIEEFVAAGGKAVHTLAVAGVGSSALGAAAFARNIADATGRPAAAVVSGYGLADVAAEALGGFLWFGALNSLRHSFELLDRFTDPHVVSEPVVHATSGATDASVDIASGWLASVSKDVRTVMALLSDPRLSFDILSGHSKGNLVISEALYGLDSQNEALTRTLAARARIVTFSAIIAMPETFRDVIDVIGQLDCFGRFNSRRDIPADLPVPGAWHHTNPSWPAALNIREWMAQALALPKGYRADTMQ